ncbi:hypothetical protein GCM10012275_08520 [Longimycelium tulufanense]|uniref:DUF4015 domain-containing protein n=1 Tax=Longimycelium tulufanense TaxID=907463 RepID=A0A8J3FSV2_9PSEU|nr:putative glycoside hydrolase [Longimycelium tulufanense]GGM39893.1 hypothetical protein GCM10012275_08520 [Longimycelium tulufanense]
MGRPSSLRDGPRPRPSLGARIRRLRARVRGLRAYCRTDRGRLVITTVAGVTVATLAASSTVLARATWSTMTLHGPDGRVMVEGQPVRDTLLVVPNRADDLLRIDVLVDGRPASTRYLDGHIILDLSDLDDGVHQLHARVPGRMLAPGDQIRRSFIVDTEPPKLELPDRFETPSLREPATASGTARGAETVRINGQEVELDSSGAFSAQLPPDTTLAKVEASDAAGNTATREVPVRFAHPGMRAVHMSATAWASKELREPVLRMIREGRIDTVELDIKDEAGEVGYESEVPLAKQVGATRNHYDPRKAIEELHRMNVRVVGRLVAFRDPILGTASWKEGKRDRLVQTTSGGAWSAHYGQYSFTNFANPEVRKYNIDLAVEAAKLGFDDILYDYIRRPDGPMGQMRVPGLRGSPEDSITSFMAEAQRAIRPHGAVVGASVFGIAATRPTEIAQDIPALAKHADYLSPMTYPSHWGPGEYGVANPNAQPYDITVRSLADFVKKTEGTGTRIFPWLQDFSMGHHYGREEVAVQIKAARDNGLKGFLLWNAGCRYTWDALSPP